MSVAELLSKVRGKAATTAATNDAAFAALVRRAARGEDLDPAKIITDLAKMGRDPAEFTAAVEALARRLELKRLADGYDDHAQRAEAARAQHAERAAALDRQEQELFDKLAAERYAALAPLEREIQTATAAVHAAEQARGELFRFVAPDLHERRRQAVTALHAADAEIARMREQIARNEPALASARAAAEKYRVSRPEKYTDFPAATTLAADTFARERAEAEEWLSRHEAITNLARRAIDDLEAGRAARRQAVAEVEKLMLVV